MAGRGSQRFDRDEPIERPRGPDGVERWPADVDAFRRDGCTIVELLVSSRWASDLEDLLRHVIIVLVDVVRAFGSARLRVPRGGRLQFPAWFLRELASLGVVIEYYDPDPA